MAHMIISSMFIEPGGKDCYGHYCQPLYHYKIKCDNCGTEFETFNYRKKYCCENCTNQAGIKNRKEKKSQARKRKCQVCGELFIPPRNDAKFCSDKCKQSAYRERKKGTLGNKRRGEIKESLVADTNGSPSHVSANNVTPKMTKPSTHGTKECEKCHQLLPIQCFRIIKPREKKYTLRTCKKCNDIQDNQRTKERKQNKENVNIESTGFTTAGGAPGCVLVNNLPRRMRKPRATGTIWISSFTFEELLRKQIWYDEPKMHGGKQRWVEPRCTIVRRLIDNSSTTKVYNYKTFQIKRSKYANVRMTVPRDTYELLKKISTRLKITEPKITYNEIIWRLIENDKTTK